MGATSAPRSGAPTGGFCAERERIAADFAAMAGAGIEVVRWFVFTDARGGLAIDRQGWPEGFLDGTLDDLDALFSLALDAGLTVVPVLFDHSLVFMPAEADGARVGGHHKWLADPDGQARLIDRIVLPLAARYGAGGSHGPLGRAVHAWDLLNEPDWIVAEHHPSPRLPAPIPFDVLAAWAADAAATIRAHQAGGTTIGSARLRFAGWWDDPSFGFDFLQAHTYYDPAHDFDLLQTPCAALGLSRPLVVGECSARGDAHDAVRRRPALSAIDLTEAAAEGGYAGAWPWSWRGVDGHGPLATDAARAIRDLADRRRGGATTSTRQP